MKRQKNNRGVTLIALVVTIIVMLILAGIGINSVIGNKGIFSNAEKSKNQTDISEEKSILKASVISAMGADSVAGITKGNLEEALDKNVKNYDLTQKTDEEYGNVYEIKFKETGNTYTILDDGTILSEEEKENNISAIKILQDTNVVLEVGEKKTIALKENLDNIESVKWKNYGEDIVEIPSSSENAKSIEILGKKIGTTTIEVEVEIKNGSETQKKTEMCQVTVRQKYEGKEKSVKLNKTEFKIDLSSTEKTVQLKATVEPSNVKTTLKWKTSDANVATVNENGLVTGVSIGTAMITVTTENGKTAQCKVIVELNPTEVVLNKTQLTLDMSKNRTEQLIATVKPENAMNNKITWSSSDSKKVKVESETGIVTALENTEENNPVRITATTPNGKSATCMVIVQTSPTSIALDKTNVTIDLSINKTAQLKETINPSTANVQTGITWKSEDSSIATVKDGLITGVKNGNTIITVTTENGKVATCKVTVQTSPISLALNQTSVTLDISTNKTVQLMPIINPSTANVQNKVTWKSEDLGIATVDKNSGLVTGVKNGSTTIIATTENGKSATCKITVQTSPTSVTLNQTNVTLDISTNKTVQLTATINPSTANVQTGITWKSNDPSIATVKDGLVTGVKNGSTTITVTTDNGKSASCKVTVQTSPTSVTMNTTSVTLDLSRTTTTTLTATVNPGTANVQRGITWSSSNNKIATVNNGVVTGVSIGTTDIIARTDNGKTCTTKVTVIATIKNLEVSPSSKDIDINKETQLTVKTTPVQTTEKVVWETSNSGVATVDQTGKVKGISKGTAIIKARNTDGTIFSTATIYVAKTHYGWYVENYTAKKDKYTKWKVFYEDDDNTYIIADKWININGHVPIVKSRVWLQGKNNDYSVSLKNATRGYSGLASSINPIAKKWLNITMDKNNKNAGYTGYMMDTEKWNGYYGNDTYAEFAIAGPTLEMYLASWNSFEDHNKMYYKTNSYGYYVGESSEPQSTTAIASTSKDSLYYPETSDTEDYNGYWLASPSAENGGTGMLYIGCLNTNNCNKDDYFGFRPVVCLKSTYKLKQIDGKEAYNIVAK